MNRPEMHFDIWQQCFREDCERQNKLPVYDNLGEECLILLWESGTEPSVQGVIEDGKNEA